MNRIKKLIAVALSAATVASVGVIGGTVTAGASGTGAGLAEYALNAYYEGWSYVCCATRSLTVWTGVMSATACP